MSEEKEDRTFVPFSDRTAKRLKTKDIRGKKYARSPDAVAKELNLPPDQKARFMKVLTGRKAFQDLRPGEYSIYDSFRNRVRSGGGY